MAEVVSVLVGLAVLFIIVAGIWVMDKTWNK